MSARHPTAVGLLSAALLLPATPAAAAAPTNEITSVQLACAVDQSGAPYQQVTVRLSHRGPVEVRVVGVDGDQRLDSDHAWLRGSGADTWVGSIYAPVAAVETHLLKADHRTSSLVDVVTPVVTAVAPCG